MTKLSRWQSQSPKETTWTDSDTQGVAVTYIQFDGNDEDAVEAFALFWQFLFDDLKDRIIERIVVREQQDCFDFDIETTPKLRNRRYHFEIEGLYELGDDPNLVDKYLDIVRKSIQVSGAFIGKRSGVISGYSFTKKVTVELV